MDTVRIPLAGKDHDFEIIRGKNERWGALTSLGNLVVKLEANHVPPEDVSLVEVTDVEPYLVGQEEFMRALRRREAP